MDAMYMKLICTEDLKLLLEQPTFIQIVNNCASIRLKHQAYSFVEFSRETKGYQEFLPSILHKKNLGAKKSSLDKV